MSDALLFAESAPAEPAGKKSADTARARRGAWRRSAAVWLAALVVYWLTLFVGTHTRPADLPVSVLDFDKALHAGAYFVLASLLLVAWRRTGARFGLAGRLAIATVVLAYGVVDELTQPYFGRSCDLLDWVADALGVGLAVALDQWRHRGNGPTRQK